MGRYKLVLFLCLFSTLAQAQAPMSTSSVASINNLRNAAYCADASVSANTITCTTAVGFTGYAAGQSVDVLLANTVTGATTINVNALGAKAVTYNGTNALTSATGLVAGGTYRLQYDGTRFVVQGIVTAASPPAAPVNSVQFNNSGAFGGSANLTWDGSIVSVVGGVTLTGTLTTGSGSGVAGTLSELQGTPCAIVANTITECAPASVTGYKVLKIGAAATGFRFFTNSLNTVTESIPPDLIYSVGTLTVGNPSSNSVLSLGITGSAPLRWQMTYDRASTFGNAQGFVIKSDAGASSVPMNCTYANPTVCAFAWNTTPGVSRVATQFDATTTTLANVTGLTATLVAGRKYSFTVTLPVTADGTGGTKYAVAGTATATSIWYTCEIQDLTSGLTSYGGGRQTALAGACALAGNADTAFQTVIRGLIVVNAAGTLTTQFAENSASGTSSILIGGSMIVQEMGT